MIFRKKTPAHLQEELSFGKQVAIFTWELFKVVVISLAIIIPVRYYLIKPFYVKGASMEPTFFDSEYLIINEITYRFESPQRGDSVVFRYPLDTRQHFIKRVVGLPGETVVINNDQVSIINEEHPEGVLIEEPYLEFETKTLGDFNVTLGDNEYYLLGDNREESLDSRSFGPVDESLIVGKTFIRGWPLDRAGFVTNQEDYNL